MEKMTYYTVVLDGIDKSGKDLIAKYIWNLDKRLNVIVRGWPSLYVYNEKFNRNANYELPYKNALYVKLNVEYDDWLIRCNITNETFIDFKNDCKLFAKAFDCLKDNKYHILEFNTSEMTAYRIATNVVKKIKELNERSLYYD